MAVGDAISLPLSLGIINRFLRSRSIKTSGGRLRLVCRNDIGTGWAEISARSSAARTAAHAGDEIVAHGEM